jgi:hypothetical protein
MTGILLTTPLLQVQQRHQGTATTATTKAQISASEAMRNDAQVPSVGGAVRGTVRGGQAVVRPRVHARGIRSKGDFFGGDRRFLNKESPPLLLSGPP